MCFKSTYAGIVKHLLFFLVRNKLPAPDTTAEYTHKDFDGWLSTVKDIPKDVTAKVVLSAEVKGSDIKWNDMAGKLTMQAIKDGKEIFKLFDCELTHFTGNCGVKAISHLYLNHG